MKKIYAFFSVYAILTIVVFYSDLSFFNEQGNSLLNLSHQAATNYCYIADHPPRTTAQKLRFGETARSRIDNTFTLHANPFTTLSEGVEFDFYTHSAILPYYINTL